MLPVVSQLLQSVLDLILDKFFVTHDLALFRLTCTAWRDICPAQTLHQRVTLQFQPGWERHATQLCHKLPKATVVVQMDSTTGLADMLRNALCDVVSCFLQSARVMSQWSLDPYQPELNKEATTLAQIREIADQFEQATPDNKQRLQLHLRLRSDQAITPAMSAELLREKSAIVEIREQVRMIKTANLLFPLDSLRCCAFTLARNPNSQSALQGVMQGAPNLDFMQMYIGTQRTVQHALKYIKVLPDLPKLTSLRIVSQGIAVCLLANLLQHMTHLELGKNVYFKVLPLRLRSICFQTLDIDYEGYPDMLTALQQAVVPVSMSVSACRPTDVVYLPKKTANLQIWSWSVHLTAILQCRQVLQGYKTCKYYVCLTY